MYWWAKKNERLNLVEGSTPSKMKKKAIRGGAGKVKAPASHYYEQKEW
jgi:hypothetical protein